MTSHHRPWYSWLLLSIVVAAVVWYIVHNAGEISRFDYRFNPLFLICSFLSLSLAYLLMFFIWLRLTSSMQLKAPFLNAAKAYFTSHLGKYVPGKVGILLVRLDAYRGYSRKKVAVAVGIEYIGLFAAMCIIVFLGFAAIPEAPDYIMITALVGIPLFLAILYPSVIKGISNKFFKIIKKEPIETFPSYPFIMLIVLGYILVGLFFGLSFYFALISVASVDFGLFLPITAAFFASAIIGIAAIFAPSGIGVREGVLFLILPAFIPKPTVIVGALAIRLIATAAELSLAGLFVLVERIHVRRNRKNNSG